MNDKIDEMEGQYNSNTQTMLSLAKKIKWEVQIIIIIFTRYYPLDLKIMNDKL